MPSRPLRIDRASCSRLAALALPLPILVLAFLVACSDLPSGPLATGTWGGEGIRLDVQESGAVVEFDCAHGTWTARADLDEGLFTVPGTFSPEPGGPVGENDPPPPVWSADYLGTVDGDDMWLQVRVPSQGLDIGPFTLSRGSPGELRKCL